MGRIYHWATKLLSYIGRVQLVKSITLTTTRYWMMCFPIPKFVLKKIEAIYRSFIWSGSNVVKSKSPVAWSTVCKPKCQWGLDIVNFTSWNHARPREVLNLWFMCHGRLPTKDRLYWFGFIQKIICSLCNAAEKSLDHLFLDCNIMRHTWMQILHWLNVHHIPRSWVEELDWITHVTRAKCWRASLLKLAFTECCMGYELIETRLGLTILCILI